MLGSGFKQGLADLWSEGFTVRKTVKFSEIPGIPQATVPDHEGSFLCVDGPQNSFIVQVGRLHGYEGLTPKSVVLPLALSHACGLKDYILTNAAGGLDPLHRPGQVMLIRDQINFTGANPLSGTVPVSADGEPLGPRFPDCTTMFDKSASYRFRDFLNAQNLTVHEGIYIGVAGPNFETPAEIRAYQKLGAQAVGMSTVWESTYLNFVGARIVGLSLISNLGAGLFDGKLDHFKVVETCKLSATKILRGLFQGIQNH